MIGVQDDELRRTLSKNPGTPLIYMSNNVLMLEPPSQANIAKEKDREEAQVSLPENVQKLAEKAGKKLRADEKKQKTEHYSAAITHLRRKQKKAKGPNPLSVKKKKQTTKPSANPSQKKETASTSAEQKPKRKRKRNKSTSAGEPPNKKPRTE